ncbi:MAG: phage holin family protein [Eubacteriales bacterium]|nr:phage holin family protein [Eubacteriales bacterium]MDD4421472.1 phage holin family protein [Eubacteriales bacterium]
MNYNEFVSPELSLLIPVLYAIGMFIKNSNIKNWLIPFILGAIGILLTFFYLISKDFPQNASDIFTLIFASITQGILSAATSVYANNLYKQFRARNEDDDKD